MYFQRRPAGFSGQGPLFGYTDPAREALGRGCFLGHHPDVQISGAGIRADCLNPFEFAAEEGGGDFSGLQIAWLPGAALKQGISTRAQ